MWKVYDNNNNNDDADDDDNKDNAHLSLWLKWDKKLLKSYFYHPIIKLVFWGKCEFILNVLVIFWIVYNL